MSVSKKNNPKIILSIIKKILKIVVIFLISLLLLLPVILLPIVTSSPKFIWIPLFIINLVFIVLPLILYLKFKTLFTWGGFLLTIIIGVISSQIFASTPPILDSENKPLSGSIASLEQVILNGSKQWITIRGKDVNKPVLLYLGIGGPGAGGFPATFTSLKPLEDNFIVVNWDQPGTGKSYHARPISSLTPQVFVDDARALTEHLRQRFHQDKIYVMGLSWGTIVGTKLVQQYPELYYAYIGNGQMVNTVENDRFGYDLALKILEDKSDFKTLNRLKRNGPPPYSGNDMAIKFADYNNILFDYMGSPNIPVIMALIPQLAKEYGYIDKINFDRGLFESFTKLYPQLDDLDFIVQIPKQKVPMYFLVGDKDVNAVASIVERYYQVLEAPYKELIWLKSGHGATAEEINDALVNHVLKNSPPKQ